jgi:hypothetical protein
MPGGALCRMSKWGLFRGICSRDGCWGIANRLACFGKPLVHGQTESIWRIGLELVLVGVMPRTRSFVQIVGFRLRGGRRGILSSDDDSDESGGAVGFFGGYSPGFYDFE